MQQMFDCKCSRLEIMHFLCNNLIIVKCEQFLLMTLFVYTA